MGLTGGWSLKQGHDYFKVRKIINVKSQNSIIVTLQITINN